MKEMIRLIIGGIIILVIIVIWRQCKQEEAVSKYNTLELKARYLGMSMQNGYWREGIYDIQVVFMKGDVTIQSKNNGQGKKYTNVKKFAEEWEVIVADKMGQAFCEDWKIPIAQK